MNGMRKCEECNCIKIKVHKKNYYEGYHAECTRCGLTTSGYLKKSDAVKAWNNKLER